ncbi:MAG: response regulator [Nitrospirae bacterium]|nr:response regulator [Magnetococcales bacterium]
MAIVVYSFLAGVAKSDAKNILIGQDHSYREPIDRLLFASIEKGDASAISIPWGGPIVLFSVTAIGVAIVFTFWFSRHITRLHWATRAEDPMAQNSREGGQTLDLLFALIGDLLCIVDRDGHLLRVSHSWSKVLGYTPEELENRIILELMHPDDLEHAQDSMVKLLSADNPPAHYDVKHFRHKDGSWHTLEWIVATYDKRLFFATGRDVTEHDRLDTQLQNALNLNEKILGDSPYGVIVFHAESGQCIFSNPAAMKIVGSPQENSLECNFREIKSWSRSGLLNMADKTLQSHQDTFTELMMEPVMDTHVWLDVRFSLMAINHEDHLLCLFNDISERKFAESLVINAKKEADLANQAKSQFLSNMSHEIRTPMNAVIGLTDLALQQETSHVVRDYLEKISRSSKSLLYIINDILDFSKIEAGKLELENSDFLLGDVFNHLADMFQSQAVQKNLEFIVYVPEGCRDPLRGDPLRLGQILTNLIGNAIKFTNVGEVETQVRIIQESREHVTLEFSIRDTGIGIESTDIPKLFNAFSQVDASTTRKFSGTGLGLSISQKLVQMMGGKIWVTSSAGQGSTFYFTATLARLPGAEKEAILLPKETTQTFKNSPNTRNLEAIASTIGGAHILLVEDNDLNRQVAQEILEAVALHVEIAKDGHEAIEKVEKLKFDLVLMDIQMPRMDGHETAKKIRKLPKLTKLPIIAMTAHVMAEERQECLASGMNDHVAKPIDRKKLYAVLMQWIQPREGLGQTQNWNHKKPDHPEWVDFPETLAGIDLDEALDRVGGNRRMLRSILFHFSQDFADIVPKIRAIMATTNPENFLKASQMVHQMRGLAGNISAIKVFNAASALEIALQNKAEEWPNALDALAQPLHEVMAAITLLKRQEVDAPFVTGDQSEYHDFNREKLFHLLEKLAYFIQRGQLDSQEVFDDLKPMLSGIAEIAGHVETLEKQIHVLNFHEANLAVTEILRSKIIRNGG